VWLPPGKAENERYAVELTVLEKNPEIRLTFGPSAETITLSSAINCNALRTFLSAADAQ
jgi:hypothetical protein